MTPLPQRPQPPIIPRQRRRPPRRHGNCHHAPESRLRGTHHASLCTSPHERQRHGVFGDFHRQHGEQTHSAGGFEGVRPGEGVFAEAEEEGFESDGGGDSCCHWLWHAMLVLGWYGDYLKYVFFSLFPLSFS